MNGLRKINVGSDFSGVGAFDYACNRVFGSKNINNVFACDMDKFARKSYLANHKEPGYFPENVYDREIPLDPLDIYMTSPPCQGFSIAGNRKGSILFFNSHEFIQKNKPRYFVFKNVKGLLSHEKDKNNKHQDVGKTFQNWINWLGGKSVNGVPVLFPDENSVPYHIYWTVLNTKDFGVPQNRERVFIVGIRDDSDNHFRWPKKIHLEKRLKDILENDVSDKYFLSEKMVENLIIHNSMRENGEIGNLQKGGERGSVYSEYSDYMSCLSATDFKQPKQILTSNKREGIKVIQLNESKKSGGKQPYQQDRIYHTQGISPALLRDKSDLCIPVLTPDRPKKRQNGRRFKEDGDPSFTLTAQDKHGVFDGFNIRRLTPRECFRLQDFPESFEFVVSDSQLYKQAGNSITVKVLELILKKLYFK